METLRSEILEMIGLILSRKNIEITSPTDNKSLYQDGLGLDSLDTAELSARLEQRYGFDPFSRDTFVSTLGELVDYMQENMSK